MLRTMKILVIEDNDQKFADVESLIEDIGRGRVIAHVLRAGTLSLAVQKAYQARYDLIVLDLMIPFIDGIQAEGSAGLELLKNLRKKGSPNIETPVVGLSAFPAEAGKVKDEFASFAVVMIEYGDDGAWKLGVRRIFDTALSRMPKVDPLDFVIMVALDEERDGYSLSDAVIGEKDVVEGLNVHYISIGASHTINGAIVRCRQMGLAASIFDTCTAIRVFQPRAVAMSGICAGFSSKVKLGQLVLASTSWEYQAGKWAKDSFEIAPHQIPLRPATKAIAEKVLGNVDTFASWENDLPFAMGRPAVRTMPSIAPVATGSAVIADQKRLSNISVQHRKLAAIDMETFGIYFACHESEWFVDHFFSLKCVVDHADSSKGDELHQYGSVVSARATIQALVALLT